MGQVTGMPLPRDPNIFTVEPGRLSCGVTIGVLCQDCRVPFLPGDVQNAASYSFPVQYVLVPGADVDSVLHRRDPSLTPAFVHAAQALEKQGVKAITGNCGYMLAYQRDVASAVSVPVLMSSLLQIPLLLSLLGPQRKLGVLVANGAGVDETMVGQIGIRPEDRDRLVFAGMEDGAHFRESVLGDSGTLDRNAVEAEVVSTACQLVAENAEISALQLECSNLGPYSVAIHRATGLPVFDWISFIEWVGRATAPPTYAGPF
jgi:hypothetical protein